MKKIRSIEDLQKLARAGKRILTLFSGGLDSTYLLDILKDYPARITAVAINVGDDIEENKLKAITEHYGVDLNIIDAKQEFAEYNLISAIQAQALYLGDYPVSSSLSRPIIAKKAIELAEALNCDAIIHTANQSQNSLRRLNGAIERSGYQGYYGSPYEFSAISREQKTKSLLKSGLVMFKSRNVSGDSNLWCREFESGILDDPENFKLTESIFTWSRWEPELHLNGNKIKIGFKQGYPVTLNDEPIKLIDLIEFINHRVGSYEIGRYVGFDHLEQDEKVLEIREAPAATILMRAYKLLETAILPTDLLKIKSLHNDIWTQEAVEGRHNSLLQNASYSFIAHTAEFISGNITFELSRGNAIAISIIAENAKYLRNRDAWEIEAANSRSIRSINIDLIQKTISKAI
ncbi:MAG: argininosuccinate synthase-related protein [Shewanella sp.]